MKKKFKLNLTRIFLSMLFVSIFSSGIVFKELPKDYREVPLRVHTVVEGESLWSIAGKYDYKNKNYLISEIMRINKLKNSKIYPGYKLSIPLY
ncbi:LysM peptidoglycan-binding domain-containing protein [Peptoniphilus raoultii]|uniref:LysM peptidoglycan-binding domain-containing protein n=1 Tax=Peptoniphilus raoultii TaxID=1776387 RepID=UPI001FD6F86E|nr:LysM peptidoglycan-binding domain-containing protein [Peptoniphilus raoultii]